MKVNKKITAMLLSAVIAAAPAAAPIMDVQTVAAATTTTKTLKNAWSKNHKYYYDKNGIEYDHEKFQSVDCAHCHE